MVAVSWEISLEYSAVKPDSLTLVGIVGFCSGSKALWLCLEFVDKVTVIARIRLQVRSDS